jgi:hypothetical protein
MDISQISANAAFAVFSEQVVVTPAAGDPLSIEGIWIEEPVSVQFGMDFKETVVRPEFHVRSVVGYARKDLLTRAGANYRIANIVPDGYGLTRLILDRAQ